MLKFTDNKATFEKKRKDGIYITITANGNTDILTAVAKELNSPWLTEDSSPAEVVLYLNLNNGKLENEFFVDKVLIDNLAAAENLLPDIKETHEKLLNAAYEETISILTKTLKT